jgi:23S rRNA U2552 (ribose-2'-O)-methylase RlmE/FtsJ
VDSVRPRSWIKLERIKQSAKLFEQRRSRAEIEAAPADDLEHVWMTANCAHDFVY